VSDLRTVKGLLALMIDKGASDLHLRTHSQVFLRIDGQLKPVEGAPLSIDDMNRIMNELMSPHQKEIFEKSYEVDFSYFLTGAGRFRCSGYRQNGSPAAVLRRIPSNVPSFENLRLPSIIPSFAELKWGLVLVTGPTGNGKSTTLASVVEYINRTRSGHIVTIEDPVEFVHADKKCSVSQREIGSDTVSFGVALRHVLRQDPNVIVVGEMRDLETVETVLQAAETGHLVLSTLHTADAVQTINRIIDMFPSHQQAQARGQLAEVLKGVLSQKLLPYTCGGRIPACEILVNTGFVKSAIIKNEPAEIDNAIRQGAHYGMQTFQQSLMQLLKDGSIRLEDALEAATNPDDLMMAVKGIESSTDSMRPI